MTPQGLKDLRQALGVSQRDMGKRLGISRVQYNRVENGAAILSKASEKLAEMLLKESIPNHPIS